MISFLYSFGLIIIRLAFGLFLVPSMIALTIGSSDQHKIHELFTKLGVKVVVGYHIVVHV